MSRKQYVVNQRVCGIISRVVFLINVTVSELSTPHAEIEKGGAGNFGSPNSEIEHTKHNQPRTRVAWIDLIRITAAFMICAGHVNWRYSGALPGTIPDSFWFFSNFVDMFVRCAVPLFLMVSGYLILRKQNSLRHGYFKRILKIAIPLFAWSVIYLFVTLWAYNVYNIGKPIDIYRGIGGILAGQSHLWFLSAILSLYIAAPILHSYLKSASRDNKIYFLLLWGCACFLYPIIADILKVLFDIEKVGFQFYIVGDSLGFFVAGYFLGHRTIRLRTCTLCIISLVFLTLAITWIGFVSQDTWLGFMSPFSENYTARMALANYMRIPLALLFFVILKYFGGILLYQKSILSVIVTFLAKLTFGIFIIHILVMYALQFGLSLDLRTFEPWFSLPLTASAVFALSALSVWLLKMIPLSHWILP
jgi:surface polysaccharide O-acyltransferase-like enzyme